MNDLRLILFDIDGVLTDGTAAYNQEGEVLWKRYNQKASFLARLGSGSAARSVEGPLVVWGEHKNIENSSNLYGVKFPFKVHENFENYQDTILLVDKGEKQVSSTVGHQLMIDHPFAKERFIQANENIQKLSDLTKVIQEQSNVRLSTPAAEKVAANTNNIKEINNKIQEQYVLIEYLEKVEKIMS